MPWLAKLLQWLSSRRYRSHPSQGDVSDVDLYLDETLESFISEEPPSDRFCTHGILARFKARMIRLFASLPVDHRDGQRLCPVCGKVPVSSARREYVLTVWFVDGDAFEYTFESGRKRECYRLTDDVLHIYLSKSAISYELELISAINFGARYIPPDPPEVLEAQRIISGRSQMRQ